MQWGVRAMGVMGELMGNQTHCQMQTQTKHGKAASCVINIAKRTWFLSFFFQVKYNNQCPKPCIQHSREKLLLSAEHLQPFKKKNRFPLASQSKSFLSLSSQSDLFTFLKSDLNKESTRARSATW